ncbi:hypothetical protein LEM8419_03001 [Neolewinella maritima]|uniref:Arginase n=1 Tax=Neolewinella maritima TaxID=1383882 RepID=A0ABN8FCR7_9BACT|nr:hypothetical protein [Neolewinella maritima]CAH1002084.1 hypothetical protein LEM8419_03001 [Neolewinella maritima]
MFTSWLRSSSVSPVLSTSCLGSHLSRWPNPAIRVAFIGVHAATADEVRRHLFPLQWDHGQLSCVDLGNLRKTTTEFAIPLLRELHEAGIVPVLLGGVGTAIPQAQYLAFGSLHRRINLLQVDQQLALSPTTSGLQVLDAAVHRTDAPAYHLSHIGSQRQMVDPALDALIQRRYFERYTLGEARAQPGDLEPCIRDADVALIDIASVLHAEAPAQRGYHPSGLSLQEAGQLCYYAGNSDRLASFGVYGLELGTEQATTAERLTAAAYAQLVWYFLHGLSRRAGDFPATTEGMTEYVVDAKLPQRMTFWRSPRSNRWWIQVPGVTELSGEMRNYLVACSYQDYLQTGQEGKLPERIVRAFSRY